MLAGFLSVLKIIGIVLLVILAVLLVLLLLVLFAPVCYKIDAGVPDTEFDDIDDIVKFDLKKLWASISFSWLLFVVRGGIEFPQNTQFTLKICGIRILPRKQKQDSSSGEEPKEDSYEEQEMSASEQSPQSQEPESVAELSSQDTGEQVTDSDSRAEENVHDEQTLSEEQVQAEEESVSGTVSEDADGDEAPSQPDIDEADSADNAGKQDFDDLENDEEEKSFIEVLWSIFDAIDNFLKTPLDVLEKIQYTISRVCGKIDMIKATLEHEIFKRAYELVKKKLIVVIKMILPDKCDIKLLIGTGDPALTANVTAVYGALYHLLYRKVSFQPDFERMAVMADVHMKGHITLFTIVYSAAVCYFNKDVKKTIRRFKKIISS